MSRSKPPSKSVWAVVPAAGSGSRFGGDAALPKQYTACGGQTVISHALSVLLDYPELEGLVVSLSADDTAFATLPEARNPLVVATTGGSTRAESVLNGLRALVEHCDATDDDWVLVHDAARPALRAEDLDLLVRKVRRAKRPDGGLLAVPARDTLKLVADQRTAQTIDRSAVWQAQTPQMCPLGVLRDALLAAGDTATDEASAMEAAGYAPLLVEGHHDNIKLTYLEDLAMVQAALRSQGRLKA